MVSLVGDKNEVIRENTMVNAGGFDLKWEKQKNDDICKQVLMLVSSHGMAHVTVQLCQQEGHHQWSCIKLIPNCEPKEENSFSLTVVLVFQQNTWGSGGRDRDRESCRCDDGWQQFFWRNSCDLHFFLYHFSHSSGPQDTSVVTHASGPAVL